MQLSIIGIDCAVQDRRIGLAYARWAEPRPIVEKACLSGRTQSVSDRISRWISTSQTTLIAMDAPLGWPVSLARALHHHTAGAPLPYDPNQCFRRETDRFIKQKVGKQPLDVGADRIARTAHAAVNLLEQLRRRHRADISLAWSPVLAQRIAAIEVYPAATLKVHGIPSSGYKRAEQEAKRTEIIDRLEKHLDIRHHAAAMQASADVLDAVVCVLAAVDFLMGRAMPPPDIALARKEGWIWTRDPESGD